MSPQFGKIRTCILVQTQWKEIHSCVLVLVYFVSTLAYFKQRSVIIIKILCGLTGNSFIAQFW